MANSTKLLPIINQIIIIIIIKKNSLFSAAEGSRERENNCRVNRFREDLEGWKGPCCCGKDLAATEVPAKTVWWTHGKWSEDKGFQPVLYEEAYDVAGPTVLPRQAVGEDL